ncbi:uncharacterized protein [Musca autumnalis]|uniref:uncharacterized protein n=1 Tax=Musca autumnalis TaxID=221902 RepID=UPI003CF7A1C1
MERIIAFSKNIKTEISNDLKGILFSLKMDVATRLDLSMLGINVQYIKHGKIVVKTLAIKELRSSHTSEYLKTVILDVLKEFDVDIRNILTITTDNGSNMLKTVRILNENKIAFWNSQKTIISEIANIVQAIPSTQVSVERLFSAMKNILSDQRNRMSATNLEHILMNAPRTFSNIVISRYIEQ